MPFTSVVLSVVSVCGGVRKREVQSRTRVTFDVLSGLEFFIFTCVINFGVYVLCHGGI